MKKLFLLTLAVASLAAQAQTKYFSKKAKISFFSETAVEKIEAHNNRVTTVLEVESGKIEFSVLITAFEFEKALMQEHFNENYMESTKYPKATFKGIVVNMKDIKLNTDGSYTANIEGEMTMHGVTKKVKESATFTVGGGKISAKSSFTIRLADYNIKDSNYIGTKIAEEIKITVNVPLYEKLVK